ncbi:MAG: Txe/YoeB family addiction module toxin [Betaproteobacteria bacterium]|nr:Txe/YoeB family addiction module toxin [Betaproteobacteria bacterium]
MAGNRVPSQVSGKRHASGESHARSRGRQGSRVQSARARIEWAPDALKDYRRWRKLEPWTADKIDALIADILRSPFAGIGKPEPLKHRLAGHWSRRITQEHRLVYRFETSLVSIVSCRYHY